MLKAFMNSPKEAEETASGVNADGSGPPPLQSVK